MTTMLMIVNYPMRPEKHRKSSSKAFGPSLHYSLGLVSEAMETGRNG